MRGNKGQYQPGQSGNPSGRPKVVGHVRDLAMQHTDLALRTLVKIAEDEAAPPAARVAASNAILDRAYGKAPVNIDSRLEVIDMGKAHAQALIDLTNKAKEAKAMEAANKADAIAVEYRDITPAF